MTAPDPVADRDDKGFDTWSLVLAVVGLAAAVAVLLEGQGPVLDLVGDTAAPGLLVFAALVLLPVVALVVVGVPLAWRLRQVGMGKKVLGRPPLAARISRTALGLLAFWAFRAFLPGSGGAAAVRARAARHGASDAQAGAGIHASTTDLGLLLATSVVLLLAFLLRAPRWRPLRVGVAAVAFLAVLSLGAVQAVDNPRSTPLGDLQQGLTDDPGDLLGSALTSADDVLLHGCSVDDLALVGAGVAVSTVPGCQALLTFDVAGPSSTDRHAYSVIEVGTADQAAIVTTALQSALPDALRAVSGGRLVLVFEGTSVLSVDRALYATLGRVQKT